MSQNQPELVGENVKVSTSGPTIACEVVGTDGKEGGEWNFIVEDLHTGNRFPIRERSVGRPDEAFTDTIYRWQNRNFDTGEWETQVESRDEEEVREAKSNQWSKSGAGGARIQKASLTLSPNGDVEESVETVDH